MDFVRAIPFHGGEHDESGEKIGKEKGDEGEQGGAKRKSNRGSKEPVAITDPATFSEKIEEKIEAAKDERSEKWIEEETGREWYQSETSTNAENDDG